MAHLSTTSQPAPLPLPSGVTSRQIDLSAYGHLSFHILEAGAPTDPLILLLHGFPEIAFSWRKVLLPLTNAAGHRRRTYHVVAPDQRGFGRTTGWDSRPYEKVDLHNFVTTIYVRDVIALVNALGYAKVECIVGHDAGAVTAAACAAIRPDVFQSVVLLSHPFGGMPRLPFNTVDAQGSSSFPPASAYIATPSINDKLRVHNRKHYKWYYSTHQANADMAGPITAQGLRGFLRGYFHLKSASWQGNHPRKLSTQMNGAPTQLSWPVDEVVKMPEYYIMPLDATMPQVVEKLMQGEPRNASRDWLPDDDLEVYVNEYARTTFQGGLNWYRVQTADGDKKPELKHDLDIFAGKRITVPCAFIGGEKDWGTYQQPGAIEKMVGDEKEVCDDFRLFRLIPNAGHWIQQERPDELVKSIFEFLGTRN